MVHWLMLACLIFVQAHSVVPHHHHDERAFEHAHTTDHNHWSGLSKDAGQLDSSHPATVAHDEPYLGSVAQREVQLSDLEYVAPESYGLIAATSEVSAEKAVEPLCGHYPTGPPGTRHTRAPPSQLTAA